LAGSIWNSTLESYTRAGRVGKAAIRGSVSAKKLGRLISRGVTRGVADVGGAVLRTGAGIGLTGLGLMMWPRPVADATLSKEFREAQTRALRALYPGGTTGPVRYDQDVEAFGGQVPELLSEFGPVPDYEEGPSPFREYLEEQFGETPLGQAVIAARELFRGPTDDELAAMGPELYEYTTPAAVEDDDGGTPAATLPAPQNVPTPRPRGGAAVRRISTAMQDPLAKKLLIGAGVLAAVRGARRSGSSSSSSSSGTPVVAPLTALNTTGVSFLGGTGGGTITTGKSGCSCKKPGPKRRCLERGPVAWRSGRFKGRNAGTKCIRFAR
jgi:hypothetical protein